MYSMKKVAVEVGDIIKKMSEHMPESFFWHYILLAAFMTIMPLYYGAAVQAILLFSLRDMRQCKIFLKNRYKKYKPPFFFVPEQLR